MKKIYVAGPDVFLYNAKEHFKHVTYAISRMGYKALIPLNDAVEPLPSAINKNNIALMREADIMIANVNPFRGVEPDSGTVWEMGFFTGMSKPVIAYATSKQSVLGRTDEYFKKIKPSGPTLLDGRPIYADRHGVEDFGLTHNLMLAENSHFVFGDYIAAMQYVNIMLSDD